MNCEFHWCRPALLLVVLVGWTAVVRGGITVETQTEPSLLWATLRERSAKVRVCYPSGATSARLTVVGLDGSATNLVATPPATFVEWKPFGDADAPAGDDLCTLTLQYLNGDAPVGEPLVSKVAVLRDVFAGASVRTEGSRDWSRTKCDKVVVPYDAGWAEGKSAPVTFRAAQAEASVVATEAAPCGWFGLCPSRQAGWEVGPYEVSLGFADDAGPTFAATLFNGVPGLIFFCK